MLSHLTIDDVQLVPRTDGRLICGDLDLGHPSNRVVTRAAAGRSGDIDTTSRWGASSVAVDVDAFDHETLDQLRALTTPGRRVTMTVAHDIDQQLRTLELVAGRCQTVAKGLAPVPQRLQLQWRNPSGVMRGATRTVEVAVGGAEGGRDYPRSYPRTYVGTGGVGSVFAHNIGEVAADVVSRIYGPCDDPQLLNLTTDEQLTFTGLSIAQGDLLTVDHARRTAKLSDGQSRYQFLDVPGSSWWQIQPGDNVLRYLAENADGSRARFEWAPTWT